MKKLSMIVVLLSVYACPASASEKLYERCVDIGMKEQMVGWEESDRYSVSVGVKRGCRMLENECEKYPGGEMCDEIKKKFLKE